MLKLSYSSKHKVQLRLMGRSYFLYLAINQSTGQIQKVWPYDGTMWKVRGSNFHGKPLNGCWDKTHKCQLHGQTTGKVREIPILLGFIWEYCWDISLFQNLTKCLNLTNWRCKRKKFDHQIQQVSSSEDHTCQKAPYELITHCLSSLAFPIVE